VGYQNRVESYWMTSTPATDYPALDEDARADVAVVGAGIAGLCTAWQLALMGRSVIVVEADRIVASTTGYTTGKLSAQHGLIYHRIRSSLGEATAKGYAAAQTAAIDWVGAVAAQLGIDCDLERLPAYTYVTDPDEVDKIRDEVDAAGAAGLLASFVTDTGLPYPVAGAIRVGDQAQFHPRRFLLGLAEDFVRRGGRIVERTRVLELTGDDPPVLRTEGGATLTANDVVVATHWPIIDRIKVYTRMTPRRDFVVAGPLPADRDPAGMYITAEDNIRSVRTAPYGDGQRLLIVTGETFRPGTARASERLDRLVEWTQRYFPVDTRAYQWAAQDHNTTDGIPYIGRMDEHLYVATGFGGWGMTNGVVAGLVIPGLIDANPPPFADLFDPGRLHPTAEAGGLLKGAVSTAVHAIADRLRPRPDEQETGRVDEILPGAGAVVRVGGEQRAVYRDEDGSLRAVSATCTHMGCVVGFNDVERSWDCPCHGSRFGTDGAVLHGPAVRPLEAQPPE